MLTENEKTLLRVCRFMMMEVMEYKYEGWYYFDVGTPTLPEEYLEVVNTSKYFEKVEVYSPLLQGFVEAIRVENLRVNEDFELSGLTPNQFGVPLWYYKREICYHKRELQ